MCSSDLVIRAGTVADGTGEPARTADVAIDDGIVVEVGRVGRGAREIDADGLPLGGGACFLRYLVAGAFSNFTCGIGGLLDLLWPLWDPNRKRLIDKWLNYSVIDARTA